MAQFRATIQGQRGMASRLGSKRTGLVAKVNGWNDGVTVELSHREGHDIIEVWSTAGSNGGRHSTLVYKSVGGAQVHV